MYYVYIEDLLTGKEIFGVTSHESKARETVKGLRANGFIAAYSQVINLDNI